MTLLPGDVSSVKDLSAVESESEAGTKVITLTAQYADVAENVAVPYTIKVTTYDEQGIQTFYVSEQAYLEKNMLIDEDSLGNRIKKNLREYEREGSLTAEIKESGQEITLFYRKYVSYTVNYLEQDTNKVLSTAKVVENQTFGNSVTENAIEIDGYDQVSPTEVTITIGVEGNVINFYYTKRTDLSYTVNYLEQGTNKVLSTAKVVENQTFGNSVIENAIEIDGYDQVSPTEVTITIGVEGNVINFYYTKRSDLSYTVNYLEQDTNKVLSTAKVVENQTFGNSVTENAIEIDGYDQVSPTEVTITIGVEGNVINFYYTKRTDLSYTVNYLEQDTNKVLSTAKVVENQTFGNSVTENAIEIDGYDQVSPTEVTITIGVEGNVINFYYTKRTDLSYTVNYLEQGTNKVLSTAKVVENQTFGNSVIENAIEIDGYDQVSPTEVTITIGVEGNVINFYYTKRTDLSYTVNYLEQDTNKVLSTAKVVENQTFGDSVIENAIAIEGYDQVSPTEVTITIGVGENVINFYYTKRTDLNYTVNYLEQGTNEVLSEAKVVTGKTFEEEVTEYAIDIEGYNKVEPTSKTIEIAVEGNVINFYYTARTDISYTVEYRLRDENGRKLLKDKTVENQTMASTVIETAEEIAGYTVDEKSKSLKLEASGNKIVFLYNVADGTGYTVERYYQNLDGSYSWFETITGRTTTTSHLAFLEDSDKVWSSSTTPGTYVFNPNAKGTVDRLIVAADGSTVLKAYFDLRVKVQYYYTDGTTAEPKLIAETAPLYKLGSAVNVPLMDGLLDPNMDFSNLWYTDATIKNSWNFDTATISGGDLRLIDGQYVLMLYTSAKVKPLATGDVVVQKIVTGNAPTDEVYNFTMDITANTPNTRPQLGDNEARQLNLLTTAEIQSARAKAEAEGQWESAKEAFKANALQVTTDSGLKFVMTDDRNNTLFGITTSSTLAFDYDAYTTFTFEGNAAEESLLDQIISFFQGLTSRPDKDSLVGLRDAVVTSGSALSFHVSDADNVYTTYQAWQKAEEDYATAAEKLYEFQVNHGLVPSKVKVQVIDQYGKVKEEYTLGKDIQADENGVYTLTFGLTAGDSCGFKFIATTGSAITFDIHENYSNDSGNFLGTNIALGSQDNIIAENSQSILNGTTGSQYIFINNFRPVDGGNGDGGGSTGGGDNGGTPSTDPGDNDTIIDDEEVPLAEPDVDDTDDGIEIDDGEVPLTDVPGEALEIDDEQVPLGDAPKTGDANNAIPFVVLMMMAGLGLAVTRRKFN